MSSLHSAPTPTTPTEPPTVFDCTEHHSEPGTYETPRPGPLRGADPLIGFVVAGRYRILERIGHGGMGVVYKVEHVDIGKLLAMKVLSGDLSRQPAIIRRFKREALLASKLASPNTVQVFDYGTTQGLTWLVMKLVDGVDLSRLLRKVGPLSFGRIERIVSDVCRSLTEAHAQGIVHRDIKPGNIMLTGMGTRYEAATVLDFGLAKLRSAHELNDISAKGSVMGTPGYMAPEQVRSRAVDSRTDVYGVGAVVYRLLTGRPPFVGPSSPEICALQLRQLPVPPHLRAPDRDIPVAVSAVVMRALSIDPDDRFETPNALYGALLDAIADTETEVVEAEVFEGDAEKAFPLVRRCATRDEVDAYERRLLRQRGISRSLGGLALVALVGTLVLAGWATFKALEAGALGATDGKPGTMISRAP